MTSALIALAVIICIIALRMVEQKVSTNPNQKCRSPKAAGSGQTRNKKMGSSWWGCYLGGEITGLWVIFHGKCRTFHASTLNIRAKFSVRTTGLSHERKFRLVSLPVLLDLQRSRSLHYGASCKFWFAKQVQNGTVIGKGKFWRGMNVKLDICFVWVLGECTTYYSIPNLVLASRPTANDASACPYFEAIDIFHTTSTSTRFSVFSLSLRPRSEGVLGGWSIHHTPTPLECYRFIWLSTRMLRDSRFLQPRRLFLLIDPTSERYLEL